MLIKCIIYAGVKGGVNGKYITYYNSILRIGPVKDGAKRKKIVYQKVLQPSTTYCHTSTISLRDNIVDEDVCPYNSA